MTLTQVMFRIWMMRWSLVIHLMVIIKHLKDQKTLTSQETKMAISTMKMRKTFSKTFSRMRSKHQIQIDNKSWQKLSPERLNKPNHFRELLNQLFNHKAQVVQEQLAVASVEAARLAEEVDLKLQHGRIDFSNLQANNKIADKQLRSLHLNCKIRIHPILNKPLK